MTAEESDKQIAQWQANLAAATENLLALDDTLAMKRIEGRDGFRPRPLAGATAARVLPAVAAMRELFNQIGVVSAVVERAAHRQRGLNRLWHYNETLAEIDSLLNGPSIPLPDNITPLAQRSLTAAFTGKRATTPQQLLSAMTGAFAAARDAVLAVEAAWERWEPFLDVQLNKEAALRAQADAAGLPVPPPLEQAGRLLREGQSRIETDPLGMGANFEIEIAALFSQARIALETARHEKSVADVALAAARGRLAELTQTEGRVTRLFTECREKGGATAQPGVGLACLNQLEAWLGSLETASRQGRGAIATAGLERWTDAADTTAQTLGAAEQTNRDLLARPAELRGRLAVAGARAVKSGTPDPALERLLLQAKLLLDEPGLPGERAVRLVAACEAKVREIRTSGK